MEKMSLYMFVAALISLGISTFFYLMHTLMLVRQGMATFRVLAGGNGKVATAGAVGTFPSLGGYATMLAANAFVFLTLSLVFRGVVTGHGPFANMYEFSQAFGWGVLLAHLYFERHYKTKALGAFVLPVALGLLVYAATVPSDVQPLVPALQNNLLLTVHVAVAIVAYGTFAVSFGAAVLFMVQRSKARSWLPAPAMLDDIGYRAVMLGFPFMALVLILGALWAHIAWGRYWAWDPKETASLITWLIYGGYLHARVVRGWRGTRSALLLMLGFVAVLFTYFGNLFFGGLHSYSGLR